MRRLPSDEGNLPRWRWSYYRWLSWSVAAASLLIALFTGCWFCVEFVQPPSGWDREMLTWLAPFSIGAGAISFVSWRAYGLLGEREPPAPE